MTDPFYKSPKFWWTGGGLALVIGTIAYLLSGTAPAEEITVHDQLATTSSRPFEHIDIAAKAYDVEASNGGTFTYNNSKIIIPEDAFLNSDGEVVKGPVEIKYREFHDVVDQFVSGIPMTYDSAGVEYHFESAGMMEILAFQGGEPLFTNPDRPITVELGSRHGGDYFNIYYLDSNTGDWSYVSRDMASAHGQHDATNPIEQASQLSHSIREIEKKKPVAPRKPDPQLYNIKIDYKVSQFPELASFENVLFEITEENENFDPDYASRDWDDVNLERTEEGYILTFFDNMEEFPFIVRPVLDGAGYSSAYADFEERFNAFETRYGTQLEEKTAKLDSLKTAMHAMEDSLGAINFANSAENIRLSEKYAIEQKIVRTFEVSAFGIWNSDCPQKLPIGRMLAIDNFLNSKDEKDTLKFQDVYLAEKDENKLFRLMNYDFQTFQYNPKSETVLWLVTEDNKLAVYHPEDFDKLDDGIESCDLKLTVHKKPKTDAHVRKLLNM